jgi:hypothetical protein
MHKTTSKSMQRARGRGGHAGVKEYNKKVRDAEKRKAREARKARKAAKPARP